MRRRLESADLRWQYEIILIIQFVSRGRVNHVSLALWNLCKGWIGRYFNLMFLDSEITTLRSICLHMRDTVMIKGKYNSY